MVRVLWEVMLVKQAVRASYDCTCALAYMGLSEVGWWGGGVEGWSE